MWIACELVFRHYNPKKLEEGMLFMNELNPGNEAKEQVEVWALKAESIHDQVSYDMMVFECGFPVQPWLITDDGRIAAIPDEIGWFDPGKRSEELIPFTITEMNFIMQEFDGLLEIFVNEDELERGIVDPVYEDNFVILRFLTDDEDAEELYLEEGFDNTTIDDPDDLE